MGCPNIAIQWQHHQLLLEFIIRQHSEFLPIVNCHDSGLVIRIGVVRYLWAVDQNNNLEAIGVIRTIRVLDRHLFRAEYYRNLREGTFNEWGREWPERKVPIPYARINQVVYTPSHLYVYNE